MFSKVTPFLFLIFCLCCCSKKKTTPVEQLPDAHTSESLSVFGCLVDGEVWRPGNGGLSLNVITYSYNRFGNFNISAKRKFSDKNIDQSISLITTFKDTGRYELSRGSFKDLNTDCWEYINETIEDYIQIDSLNTDARVIIGRFEFTAIDTFCNDTFRITDGRLKASY